MKSNLLEKAYEPHEVEKRWYAYWEAQDLFAAREASSQKAYSIVIPPPNVTGVLHMGHALNNTLQDVLCRYRRLRGDNVLWMPGTDHAGIATQNVVEKKLAAEGSDRHQLGREKFIEAVWEWRKKYGGEIINQLKRLGASCDWNRERFTMDEGLSQAVRKVFVELYHEGLIYRDDYIINWCHRCHTALADLEVEHEERDGHLYHIRYPFAGGDGDMVVATTRPETMLGDTAVAVHPDDERYLNLRSESVVLPLMNREIPLVTIPLFLNKVVLHPHGIAYPLFERLIDVFSALLPEDGPEHIEVPVVVIPVRTRVFAAPFGPAVAHRLGLRRGRYINPRPGLQQVHHRRLPLLLGQRNPLLYAKLLQCHGRIDLAFLDVNAVKRAQKALARRVGAKVVGRISPFKDDFAIGDDRQGRHTPSLKPRHKSFQL